MSVCVCVCVENLHSLAIAGSCRLPANEIQIWLPFLGCWAKRGSILERVYAVTTCYLLFQCLGGERVLVGGFFFVFFLLLLWLISTLQLFSRNLRSLYNYPTS